MALNFKKIWNGLKLVKKASLAPDPSSGDLQVVTVSGKDKLYYNDGASDSVIVTEAHAATFTNKTFDANATGNTLSNVETADLASGVLVKSVDGGGTGITALSTDSQIPSAKAVYKALDNQNQASEITFTATIDIPDTNVQDAIEQVQSNLQAHIDEATAVHAASAILVNPSVGGATDVQASLTNHQSHIDASTNVHGLAVGSSVVGTTDSQVLTNKTITGASIRTPSRSDVKQDTLANLTTYATTASNGQIVYATDEKKMYQVVDGALVGIGGAGIVKLTAGENIAAFDLVYISTGTGNDSGRTAGRIYKADASNDDRADVLGFAPKAITSGSIGEVQTSGNLSGFTGLTAGNLYYASITPGAITTTPPSSNGQWIIPVGLSASSTELVINSAPSASAIYINNVDIAFTIINNQSSAANITGLSFNPVTYRSAKVEYAIYRQTDTALTGVAQVGQLRLVYNSQQASWLLSDDYAGQSSGVEFSITALGQVQYTSSDLGAGTNYVGSLKYNVIKTFGV